MKKRTERDKPGAPTIAPGGSESSGRNERSCDERIAGAIDFHLWKALSVNTKGQHRRGPVAGPEIRQTQTGRPPVSAPRRRSSSYHRRSLPPQDHFHLILQLGAWLSG